METRVLGGGLRVSAAGLECMGFSHIYGASKERKEAVRSIRTAYEDAGVTFFDTAEVYGTADNPHDNERLVGEALREIRNKVQIVSKFGISLTPARNRKQ